MPASANPMVPSDLDAWLSANDRRIHEELFEFLRIPSVSARSEHNSDVAHAARWLHQKLAAIGFSVETIPTAGHPVVLGEWRKAPEGAPTILVYGHYDVQPPEPLELWASPAFEPTIRDGKLFARGSVDDKGQLWIHVKALEAHLATRGTLPVNVIVVAEGEEEIGSEHLGPFVDQHAKRLAADVVIISDSAMFAPGIPSILSSLRGLAYFEINVQGPSSDLHSGSYGGAVVNPAMALARILATFHDADGRVAIPGFYDAVRPFPNAVIDGMRTLPFDDAAFMHEVGVASLGAFRSKRARTGRRKVAQESGATLAHHVRRSELVEVVLAKIAWKNQVHQLIEQLGDATLRGQRRVFVVVDVAVVREHRVAAEASRFPSIRLEGGIGMNALTQV